MVAFLPPENVNANVFGHAFVCVCVCLSVLFVLQLLRALIRNFIFDMQVRIQNM